MSGKRRAFQAKPAYFETMKTLKIKRIYEPYDPKDGFRILVDRLWPRGIKKVDTKIDLWEKEIAPSTELRKWFGHQPDLFPEFETRYEKELENNPITPEFINIIRSHLETENVTLLYGAKDQKDNQAVVLFEWLQKQI